MATQAEFEAWQNFRDGEKVISVHLECTECGGKAEGNSRWCDGSGEICDACIKKQDEEDHALLQEPAKEKKR